MVVLRTIFRPLLAIISCSIIFWIIHNILLNRHARDKNIGIQIINAQYQDRKPLFREKTVERSRNITSSESSVSLRLSVATMGFDFDVVNDSFTKCLDQELDLEAYNQGYSELYNFFSMLGSVFGFIASDVKEKIDILDNFRQDNNEHKGKYQKAESMMLHEIQVNKENNAELVGSRTLLRLHRALKFTMLFLERLMTLQENEKVSKMATDAYSESLGDFHPWYIRNAAKLAMYSLPTKKNFMKKIVPEGADEGLVVEKISTGVDALRNVYISMEELYTKHDLHGLP